MKKILLNESKKIELEILKKINDLCIQNGLKLYLGGGTLLGAIRHKGFIPWDDDIDVMMMRDDYEKLLDLFKNKEIDGVKLLSYHYNKDYYYPFLKAVNVNTIMEEIKMNDIKDLGIYIDIFPIDYIPTKKINKLFNIRKLYQSMFNFKAFKNVYELSDGKIKKLCKTIVGPLFRSFPSTYAAKKIDNMLKKYNCENSDNVVCFSGRYVEKEVMPKEYISDSVEVEFEGEKYLAPIGYDDYLTKHYGPNYMELPPKEKQKAGHDNIAYWK